MNLLNAVQSGIMWIGISVGLLVCTAGVSRGELTVGDVVLFLSLMTQLYGPLNWFGTYYRTIQQVRSMHMYMLHTSLPTFQMRFSNNGQQTHT